jgi:hypothetical protein
MTYVPHAYVTGSKTIVKPTDGREVTGITKNLLNEGCQIRLKGEAKPRFMTIPYAETRAGSADPPRVAARRTAALDRRRPLRGRPQALR